MENKMLIPASTMESLQDSPSRTKVSMTKALSNISSLLADLDDFESDRGEMKRVHDKVDALLEQTADQQSELSEDLSSLYAALRKGHMTPAELETLVVSEQEKSVFILNLSATVNTHLQDLCKHIQEMAMHAHEGGPVTGDYLDSLGQQVELVNMQLKNVTKAASSPPKKFVSTPFISTLKNDHEEGMKKIKQEFDDIARRVGGKGKPTVIGNHGPVTHATRRRPQSAVAPPEVQAIKKEIPKMEDKECQANFDGDGMHSDYYHHSSGADDSHDDDSGHHREHCGANGAEQQQQQQQHRSRPSSGVAAGGGGRRQGQGKRQGPGQASDSQSGGSSSTPPSAQVVYTHASAGGAASKGNSRPGSAVSRPSSALGNSAVSRTASGTNSIVDELKDEKGNFTPNHSQEESAAVSRIPSSAGSRRSSADNVTGGGGSSSNAPHHGDKAAAGKGGSIAAVEGPSHGKARRGSREAILSSDELALRARDAEKLKQAKYTISSLEKKVKDLERQVKDHAEKEKRERELATPSKSEFDPSAPDSVVVRADGNINYSAADLTSQGPSSANSTQQNPKFLQQQGRPIDQNQGPAGQHSGQSQGQPHQHAGQHSGQYQSQPHQHAGQHSGQSQGQPHQHAGQHSGQYQGQPHHPSQQQPVEQHLGQHHGQHQQNILGGNLMEHGSMHHSSMNSRHDDFDGVSFTSDGSESIGHKAKRLLTMAGGVEDRQDPINKDDCVVFGDAYKSLDSLQNAHYIANNSASVPGKTGNPRIIKAPDSSVVLAGLRYDEMSGAESAVSVSIRLYSPGNSVMHNHDGRGFGGAAADHADHIVIPSTMLAQSSSSSSYVARAQSARGTRFGNDGSSSPALQRPTTSHARTGQFNQSLQRFDRNPKGVLNAYLAADRDVAALRSKDSKWVEAKDILKSSCGDKAVTTDDLEEFLQNGASAVVFTGARVLVPKIQSQKAMSPIPNYGSSSKNKTKLLTMDDSLDVSPRVTASKQPFSRSGTPGLEGATLPRSESTHYKPTAADIATLAPAVSRLGVNVAPVDFTADLQASDRPLHKLFAHYKSYLPDNARSSLIRAMYHELLHSEGIRMRSMKDTPDSADPAAPLEDGKLPLYLPKSLKQINDFFKECLEMIITLNSKANSCLTAIEMCERSVTVLISMTHDPTCHPDVYNRSLTATFKKLGNVSSLKLQVALELAEFRTFFEGINALSASSFNSMIKQSAEFKKSYEFYKDTQGQSVEASERLSKLKNLCRQEKLFAQSKDTALGEDNYLGYADPDRTATSVFLEYPISPIASPSKEKFVKHHAHGGGGSSAGPTAQPNVANGQHAADSAGAGAGSAAAAVTAVTIAAYKSRVEALEEELDDTKMAVVRLINEKDLTPGALMFYATLSDPMSVITFKDLHSKLNDIKEFIQSGEHFDFKTVRRKLLECVTSVPLLHRFNVRYAELHKRWTEFRIGMFTKRGLQGGNADGFYTCPICHHDNRSEHQMQRATSAGPGTMNESDIHGLFPNRNPNKGGANKSVQKLRAGIVSARDPAGVSSPRSAIGSRSGHASTSISIDQLPQRATLRVPSAVAEDEVSLQSGQFSQATDLYKRS